MSGAEADEDSPTAIRASGNPLFSVLENRMRIQVLPSDVRDLAAPTKSSVSRKRI